MAFRRILNELATAQQREVFFTILRLIRPRMANSTFRSSPPLTMRELVEGFPNNIQSLAERIVELMEVRQLFIRTPGSHPTTYRINPNRVRDILDMLNEQL